MSDDTPSNIVTIALCEQLALAAIDTTIRRLQRSKRKTAKAEVRALTKAQARIKASFAYALGMRGAPETLFKRGMP